MNGKNGNIIEVVGNAPTQMYCTATIAANAAAASSFPVSMYPNGFDSSGGSTAVLVPLTKFWHIVKVEVDNAITPNAQIQFTLDGTQLPVSLALNSYVSSLPNPAPLSVSIVLAAGKTLSQNITIMAANTSTAAVPVAYTLSIVSESVQ